MAKAGLSGGDFGGIGGGCDADQNVIGQRFAGRDDHMVAQERVAAQRGMAQPHGAMADHAAAQVNAVGKEGFGADRHQFGNDIGDRADFATLAHLHPRQPQPFRPEQRSGQPFTRQREHSGFQPGAQIGGAPARNRAGLHAPHQPHHQRGPYQRDRQRQHRHHQHDRARTR